ncbi:MAG: hypothetical protein Q7S60_03815 [bacterium]|nr:hypothetical protein [bacterium]
MAIATFSGRPRSQVILPINLDGGDGSDGAFSSSASVSYSAITGVAATGDVYIGNFTTFALNDAHTLTLDQKFHLLLATGAVTLGGGTSGTITGTGNGPLGGVNPGSQGPSDGGSGPGGGEGSGGNDSNQGGGGGGGRADGTDGSIGNSPAPLGGKQVGWLDYFLTGDLDMIGSGGGGGAGSTQINVAAGGNGGNAGAGLYIVSRVSITLKVGFAWTSSGANGTAATGGAGKGGGGGGGGGHCILAAPIIVIEHTSGTAITSLGGTGAAGSSTGTGGDGSNGNIVLLYSRYYSVGGTKMDATALAARTNPDADVYAFAPYDVTGFGRRLRATVAS